jgi:hypothetical protein
MKRILLTLAISAICYCSHAQINVVADTTAIGMGATSILWNYKFTYLNHLIAHGGLGWYNDPQFTGGQTAYLGGYSGIKMFTTGQARLVLNSAGNMGLGTTTPLNKFVINAGENNRTIEIAGNNFNGNPNTHYFPALSFYSTHDGLRAAAPSAEIVFSDRPGTLNYAINSRTSDILFYTAHSYDAPSNLYGNYPDLTMVIRSTQDGGYVGIGTTHPDQKLTVNGTVHAKSVLVDLNVPVPDYVFDPGYPLLSLGEVKTFIDSHRHLPEIPSAEQVAKEGLNVGEMNVKLLKKVEELTLYLIEQNKQLAAQNEAIKSDHEEINKLREQLSILTKSLIKN